MPSFGNMAEGSNPDQLPVIPPEYQVERKGSMSLGAAPNGNGDDVSPINSDAATAPLTSSLPPNQLDPNAKGVHDVVNSEIGVATLLNRLKQSIASAKEFAGFLKKRSILEGEHSEGLKKLCRVTAESIRRPEHRHGSFLQAYEDVTNIHERMADNGAQFAISLHQMHEDLLEMAANMERGRKHWKTTGLQAEQRVADSEAAMRKSKTKYDGLAEDYDRARTGQGQSGKIFGLKGPKSAAQHEEDLLRKLQAADSDYASKVTIAQGQQAELLSKLRPDAVRAIQDLIKEMDSALTLQMQKFATFNEKLLLSNGLNVSPLKGSEPAANQPRSLRETVSGINNDQDLNNYISSFARQVPPRHPDIKYERHPTLNPQQQQPPPLNAAAQQRQSDPNASYSSRQGPPQSFGAVNPPQQAQSQPHNQGPPPAMQPHERSFSMGQPLQQYGNNGATGGPTRGSGAAHIPSYGSGSISSSGPPQLSTLPFQNSQTPPLMSPQQQTQPYSPAKPQPQIQPYLQTQAHSQQQVPPQQQVPQNPPQQQQQPNPYYNPTQAAVPATAKQGPLPPLKPVFGLGLDQLFDRDGSAVPMVVYQCIQAIDLFGLEVEGIYRLSGSQAHIQTIKAMFDNDASTVDFRDPAAFFHDVNSVAGLLKQFFRELPDPLLTGEHYASFIDAARTDDDIMRRDQLHAVINSLPDPNYATLRALTLHLNRVSENSTVNRMNASNLAIVFGPTMMGASTGPNIQDAGWQVRVVQTILENTYQIFDDD